MAQLNATCEAFRAMTANRLYFEVIKRKRQETIPSAPMESERNLTEGNYKHGFYYDGFLPCKECPDMQECKVKGKFYHKNRSRCIEERDFFENTITDIEHNFQLDSKDLFQLPLMVMNMIKIKRMNRYMALKGPVQQTPLFNPKSGEAHWMDTSNVLSRDAFYAQKALISYLDSLRLTRKSRDAKDGIDVLAKMMSDRIQEQKKKEGAPG